MLDINGNYWSGGPQLVQDNQIVRIRWKAMHLETFRTFYTILLLTALEHWRWWWWEQYSNTGPSNLPGSLNHLEVEVDQVVDLEEEDQNLPIVEV